MRKLLAFCLCAMFVIGDATIYSLQSARAGSLRDERGESVLRQAREALGGDAVINAVQNLLMNGKLNHKIKTPDGQERSFDGNVEMALETSGRIFKNIKIGDGTNGAAEIGKRVVIKHDDVIINRNPSNAETEKFQKRLAGAQGDELSRFLFGLLLKTSPSLNAVYNYVGEGDVDGTSADIVEARNDEGFAVKLYIDKNSHLPLMMSYRAAKPLQFLIKREGAPMGGVTRDFKILRSENPEPPKVNGEEGGTRIIIRKMDGNGNTSETVKSAEGLPRLNMEEAEFQIRFSDYRSVNGLMLPHRIAQTINGEAGETMTIDTYQVNVPNLADRFRENVNVVRKPVQQ